MERSACRHCSAVDSELKTETRYRGHQVYLAYYVQCCHCGSRTRDYPDEESAVNAWNGTGEKEQAAHAAMRTARKK